MLKTFHAEFYRTMKNRATLALAVGGAAVAILPILAILYCKSIDPTWEYANTSMMFPLMAGFLGTVSYVIPVAFTVYFGGEFRNHTFKNAVSFGGQRAGLVIQKFLQQAVCCTVLFFLVAGVLIGGILLTCQSAGTEPLLFFLRVLLSYYPLWIGMLALLNFASYLMESETSGMLIYYFVLILLPVLFNLLGRLWPFMNELYPYTLSGAFDAVLSIGSLTSFTELVGPSTMLSSWAIGMGWTVGLIALSCVLFRRKEIK